MRGAGARDVDGVDEQLERVRDAVGAVQIHERVERGRFRQAGYPCGGILEGGATGFYTGKGHIPKAVSEP